MVFAKDEEQRSSTAMYLQGWLDFVFSIDPSRYSILAVYVERLRKKWPSSPVSTMRIRGLRGQTDTND
jgi:hypothetical protein